MILFPILSFGLIMVLLMVMLTQARPWVKAKIPGKIIKTVPIGFWRRIDLHRSKLLAVALGTLLGRVSGWMPEPVAIFVLCFALAILFFPMNYTFTTQGVAVGCAVFRSWKEFTSISQKSEHIVLEHPSSFMGGLILFVKPVEIESVLIRLKKSYQQI